MPSVAIAQGAKNIKKGTGWVKLGQTLFSDKVLNLSPSAIVGLLQQAGIKVPKGAVIGADVAQLIAAGGAFATDIERGASISSFALPTSAAIQASVSLLSAVGLMDPKSPAAQLLSFGADIGMVVATGGVNVLADLKLAMDIVQNLFMAPDASAIAKQNVMNVLAQKSALETSALARNFTAYQNGLINSFDLIGLVAQESPDYFDNYFPVASRFFPPSLMTVSSTASGGMFGMNTSTYTWTFETLQYSHQQIIQNIWNYLILPQLQPYKDLDAANPNKIHSHQLAALSMLPPYIKSFPEQFNANIVLKKLFLTPQDLGGPSVSNIYDNSSAKNLRLKDAEKRGYFGYILKDSKVNDYMSNWGQIDISGTAFIPIPDPPPSKAKMGFMLPTLGSNLGRRMFLSIRDTRNYWSALSLYNTIKNDPYFAGISAQVQQYDFLGTIDSFNQLYKDLVYKIHSRMLNELAIFNIAGFFNTKPENMIRVTPLEPGQLAIFKPR